jgi:hypothetical protein
MTHPIKRIDEVFRRLEEDLSRDVPDHRDWYTERVREVLRTYPLDGSEPHAPMQAGDEDLEFRIAIAHQLCITACDALAGCAPPPPAGSVEAPAVEITATAPPSAESDCKRPFKAIHGSAVRKARGRAHLSLLRKPG